MSNVDNDLEFDSTTLAGIFNENELISFQKWLHESEYHNINFDISYINHLNRFHGGSPRKRYFYTANGTKHVIERFLNFLPANSEHPLEQYSVPCIWSMIDDRLGMNLMPFAILFAGDMLCFDFSDIGKPKVVVWFHELSYENHPYTEFVSSSFDEFLQCLSDE
jgi:hypothetical protein